MNSLRFLFSIIASMVLGALVCLLISMLLLYWHHQITQYDQIVPALQWSWHYLTLRLNYLIRLLPLLGLLGLAGLVDGLTQRAVRRANAARESAVIYHQSKCLANVCLNLTIVLALALPISANTLQWLFMIGVSLFALFTQISTKHFKKYL